MNIPLSTILLSFDNDDDDDCSGFDFCFISKNRVCYKVCTPPISKIAFQDKTLRKRNQTMIWCLFRYANKNQHQTKNIFFCDRIKISLNILVFTSPPQRFLPWKCTGILVSLLASLHFFAFHTFLNALVFDFTVIFDLDVIKVWMD